MNERLPGTLHVGRKDPRGWAYNPTKWEYHFERVDGDILQVQATAGALGARGWELVGLHLFPLAGVHLIFKRPLEQSQSPGKVREYPKSKDKPLVKEL